MSDTVMFIHGAWLTPASWDPFRGRFEAHGFTCLAPPWPLEDRPLEELRRSPHPGLAQLTVGRIVDHYAALVDALPEPPILVGHSFGGFFVQALLDRGLGAAGVAIDPLPPRFVLPRPRALLSALPVLRAWNGWNRVLTMSFENFAKDFANGVPASEQRAAYDRHVVPTPGRIYFQAALWIGTGVNWSNPDRAPLLLIAGGEDRTVEQSMVEAAWHNHSRSPAKTAFMAFPGRSHFICGEPGWEEVADYAIRWVSENRKPEG